MSSSFLACNSYDCLAPYVDIILHRGWFWAKSADLGSVRWCCFRSCWTVLSHMMRGRPSCLLQSAGGEANRILLASAFSSMRIICPNRVSRRDWIIAVSLGCFVSLRTSSFHTNWYHFMPSSIRRHHWSSASATKKVPRVRRFQRCSLKIVHKFAGRSPTQISTADHYSMSNISETIQNIDAFYYDKPQIKSNK